MNVIIADPEFHYAQSTGYLRAELTAAEKTLRAALESHSTIAGLRQSVATTLISIRRTLADQAERDKTRDARLAQ